MMGGENGHRKIGGAADFDKRGQAVIAEKRVTLTLEFRVSFREITPATVVEMYPSRDAEEVPVDEAQLEAVERQGRLLRALLEDEDVLRQFVGCAVIEEIATGGGELLRKGLKVGGEEEALRPLIEALGGEITAFYAGIEGEDMFVENIDLLLFSTPVKCLEVRGRVVDMNEVGGESDKYTK